MFVQLQANIEAAEGTRVPKVLPQGPPTPNDPTSGSVGGEGVGPQHACHPPQQQQSQQHQRRVVGAAEENGAATAPEGESDAPEASQPAKKKTAGDLVKEVEVQGSEDPEEAGVDMEEDLDDDELLGECFHVKGGMVLFVSWWYSGVPLTDSAPKRRHKF